MGGLRLSGTGQFTPSVDSEESSRRRFHHHFQRVSRKWHGREVAPQQTSVNEKCGNVETNDGADQSSVVEGRFWTGRGRSLWQTKLTESEFFHGTCASKNA